MLFTPVYLDLNNLHRLFPVPVVKSAACDYVTEPEPTPNVAFGPTSVLEPETGQLIDESLDIK